MYFYGVFDIMFEIAKIIFNFNLKDELALFSNSPDTHPPTLLQNIVLRLETVTFDLMIQFLSLYL